MKKTFLRTLVLLSVVACVGTAQSELARFDFSGDLTSSSTNPLTTVSDLSLTLPFMFGGNTKFCLPGEWSNLTPQGPFNNSLAFVEFTVTPVNGVPITYNSFVFDSFRGSGGAADTIEFAGIYADEDPGPGGDNFATLLASGDVFPQQSGSGLTTLDISGAPFLQNVTSPVTFRVYFWTDAQNVGSSNAEFESIALLGGCVGFTPEVVSLGPSCGTALDPVLTADLPILGSTPKIYMSSIFPNAEVLPFISVGPVTPFMLFPAGFPQGCTIYVDVMNMANNLVLLGVFSTDANGDWCLGIPIPVEPALLGMEFIVQVRLCAPNGPPGPLAPDWSTNGIKLRVGCP